MYSIIEWGIRSKEVRVNLDGKQYKKIVKCFNCLESFLHIIMIVKPFFKRHSTFTLLFTSKSIIFVVSTGCFNFSLDNSRRWSPKKCTLLLDIYPYYFLSYRVLRFWQKFLFAFKWIVIIYEASDTCITFNFGKLAHQTAEKSLFEHTHFQALGN